MSDNNLNHKIKKSMRGASQQEIATKLGLSKMRICQLEKVILRKMKKSKILQEYIEL